MAANSHTTNSNSNDDNGDEVTRAIQNSRFNETVVLTVPVQQQGTTSAAAREILLVPCLDDQNGGIVWNDLLSTSSVLSDACDVGIVRHLRTKQWFFPMLNDARRNKLYQSAIQVASKEVAQRLLHSSTNSTIRILDIGSGTGLLAMMAATSCQKALHVLEETGDNTSTTTNKSVQVTSLEMSAAMSRLARWTIQDNHLQDTITVREQHSCQLLLDTHKQKYNLCVSELLESSLLQEGMLPALRDAWERLLEPNAIMVPQKARIYAQLMEGPFVAQYWGPHCCTSCSDGIRLGRTPDPNDLLLDGGARGGLILPIHADHWMMMKDNGSINHDNDHDELKPLSNPFQVLDFDFSRPGALPGPQGRCRPTTVIPHSNGIVHAMLLWWELDLYGSHKEEENSYMYSTQVGKEPWQDHWHQCLFIFTNDTRNSDGEDPAITTPTTHNDAIPVSFGYPVKKGQPVQVMASHNDTNMWFSIRIPAEKNKKDDSQQHDSTDDDGNNPSKHKRAKREINPTNRKGAEEDRQLLQPPLSEMQQNNSTVISPHRAWQFNDPQRQGFLRRAIREALHQKGLSAKVLDLSDFSLCAVLAAVEGATRVWSLESSSGAIPILSAEVAQLGNGLPRNINSNNNGAAAVFQILQCHAEQLSLELLSTRGELGDNQDDNSSIPAATPVEIVVGEPYYEMLEGWHLQESLNYFYLVRALKRRGIIALNAISVPGCAIVKGCAIECCNLKRAYSRCGDGNMDGETPNICGLDHTQANQHGDRFHEYDLSLPMWEYDYKELTSHFEIARITYNGNRDNDDDDSDDGTPRQIFDSRAPFHLGQKGTCHALLFWVDYGFDFDRSDSFKASDSDIGSHSTLGRSYRQLVRMLGSPFVLDSKDGTHEITCHFEFGHQTDLESYKLDLSVRKVSP